MQIASLLQLGMLTSPAFHTGFSSYLRAAVDVHCMPGGHGPIVNGPDDWTSTELAFLVSYGAPELEPTVKGIINRHYQVLLPVELATFGCLRECV